MLEMHPYPKIAAAAAAAAAVDDNNEDGVAVVAAGTHPPIIHKTAPWIGKRKPRLRLYYIATNLLARPHR
jgi:hypothetical protein